VLAACLLAGWSNSHHPLNRHTLYSTLHSAPPTPTHTTPHRDPGVVVSVVEATLPQGAALAVFDAVTSNSAVALPLEQLIAVCRRRGVPVLIDGAHALGQLPLDISALAPDYLVANCHKWLGGARGSALLWVARGKQAGVRPLIVSHGSGAGFLSDFIWDGCRDYAPLLSLSTALAWWRAVGPERARAYMTALLVDAVALLTQRWGTEAIAPRAMLAAMACVELPAATAQAAQQQRRRAERQQQQQQDEGGGAGADGEPLGPASSPDASWIQVGAGC